MALVNGAIVRDGNLLRRVERLMAKGDDFQVPAEPASGDGRQLVENSRRTPRKASGTGTLDGQIQKQIGNRLKNLYEEVINEEVPDRFLKLLQQLDGKKAPPEQ